MSAVLSGMLKGPTVRGPEVWGVGHVCLRFVTCHKETLPLPQAFSMDSPLGSKTERAKLKTCEGGHPAGDQLCLPSATPAPTGLQGHVQGAE